MLSTAKAPGEGEHKIMDFLRRARLAGATVDVDPAAPAGSAAPGEQCHCMYGTDADLIMLALATRERNMMILREADPRRQWFGSEAPGAPHWLPELNSSTEEYTQAVSVSSPAANAQPDAVGYSYLEMFLVPVLADYLEQEYRKVFAPAALVPFDIDRLLDDIILLTVLVGNDFLPGLPGFTITEEGLDTIFEVRLLPETQGFVVHVPLSS